MGGHHCLYYDSIKYLTGVIVGFLRGEIKKNRLCLWILPEGLRAEAAKGALRENWADLDQYFETGQLEILEFHEWYTPSGAFNQEEMLKAWAKKEKQALELGFSALFAIGDGSRFLKEHREELLAYESAVAKAISQSKILALCTYSTENFSGEERKILSKHHDVTLSHLHGTLTISN